MTSISEKKVAQNQGLYLHVPFCEKKCDYCDFNSYKINLKQSLKWQRKFQREISIRLKNSLQPRTLYIGGGTPSVLSSKAITALFSTLSRYVHIQKMDEVTIEANPSSLNRSKLHQLLQSGITRFSLGVQSFNDDILNQLGRVHSASRARASLELLLESGVCFSLDLMFGLPGQTTALFLDDIKSAVQFSPSHISLYGLSIEPHTVFHHKWKSGLLTDYPNEQYDKMYLNASEYLISKGYQRYEVSNFCLSGYESKHNQNYWNHTPYLGLGPGAHSLIGNCRYENPRSLEAYFSWVDKRCRLSLLQKDALDIQKTYEECIWLGLRTAGGIHPPTLAKRFSRQPSPDKLNSWSMQKRLRRTPSGHYQLVNDGWLYLDTITVDLLSDTKEIL